jgi:hypothetical protein
VDLGVVALIIGSLWVGLFVLVLAMCKAASHADKREQTLERRRVARPARLRRPHFHGLHLHRG